ncbi:DM13 domain-containing protein [Robertkochia solimangrovi]|uniref:DM13 domain-containing protein n=1 Tax=Robertkochia solimangrovi TaxID=2213046 RepID=UPI00117FD314|nr:DM13 domain-containing protein [Robertkochia solimangrovi]TRZ46114.1 hypothetical protein DMZ48_02290 [Robertkochia solimangrovi]
MRSLLLLLVILYAITISCSSSDDSSPVNNPTVNTPDEMAMDEEDDSMTEDDSLLMGDFISVAHDTEGKASVNNEMTEISLSDFKSDDGPLLELYLATDENATDYITLGELKGLEGNYTYDIPENVNFETHKYLIVWCVEFSVNFGYAVLE